MTGKIPIGAVALLAATAGLAGCAGELPPQGRQLLLDCYAAYNSGDDPGARQGCDRFLREYASSARSAEAWRIRALANYRAGDRPAAKQDMLQVLRRTQHRELRAAALLVLGHVAHADGDLPEAQRRYRACLLVAVRSGNAAGQAHWRLANILQRRGEFSEADIHFEHLIFLEKDSDLARRAGNLVGAKAWTVQAGRFPSRSGAEGRVAQLRAHALPARRQAVRVGERLFSAVWVGRFATHAEAAEMLAKVRPHVPESFIATDNLHAE